MNAELYILDDNPDYHFLMYKIIKQLDKPYCCTFFEDGNVLYRHLDSLSRRQVNTELPGLIILDLNMPQMNGMQLLKLLKQPTRKGHECFTQIPVVVMSSDTRKEKILRCYETGANAYIIKPVGYEQTIATMKGICKFWLDEKPDV